jgi:hypothetical protein
MPFELLLAKFDFGKADAVWRHVTEDDATKPFHVLHMGSVRDDSMSIQLLSLHVFPAMPLSGLPHLRNCSYILPPTLHYNINTV